MSPLFSTKLIILHDYKFLISKFIIINSFNNNLFKCLLNYAHAGEPFWVYVYHMHAGAIEDRPEQLELSSSCESPCGLWKPNMGPLEQC